MAADGLVSRELKTLKVELSISQKERAAAVSAAEGTGPVHVGGPVTETPGNKEMSDQLGQFVDELKGLFDGVDKSISAHPERSVYRCNARRDVDRPVVWKALRSRDNDRSPHSRSAGPPQSGFSYREDLAEPPSAGEMRRNQEFSNLTESKPDARDFVPASIILQKLHDEAPSDYFTLDWLMSKLQKQSFGLLMLVLALVAAAPGICLLGGFLLLIPAFQMIIGRTAPTFPRWISARPLPTRHLGTIVQRATSVLKYLEGAIHPRGRIPVEAGKRVVGIAVVLLSARLILNPIPLSNILPAVVIALISLAYAEEDGLILSICLLAGFAIAAIDLAIVWYIIMAS
jgi:hypothetical protein